MVTLCAASGFVVHFFPTGQGNVIGNPILPVIKICANPRTVRTMSEHVDVDTSGLLQREITMDQAGDKLLDMMFRTANGRLTAAEALGPPRVRADAAVRERLTRDRPRWRAMGTGPLARPQHRFGAVRGRARHDRAATTCPRRRRMRRLQHHAGSRARCAGASACLPPAAPRGDGRDQRSRSSTASATCR